MAQGQRGANLLLSTAASKSHGASKADCITRPLFRKHRPFVLASSNRCTVSPYCDVAESGRVSALGAALSNVIGCIVFIRRVKSGMVLQHFCYRQWLCYLCNGLDGDSSGLSHQLIQDQVACFLLLMGFKCICNCCVASI